MPRRNWKRFHPNNLREAIEGCVRFAQDRRNLSVERIADRMGLSSHWTLYKYMESGRLPANLIRPFEMACSTNFVTRYLAHSDHQLLVPIPSGRTPSGTELNDLQGAFSQAFSDLVKFADGKAEAEDTLASLTEVLEQLAWHRGAVEKHMQPEFSFDE